VRARPGAKACHVEREESREISYPGQKTQKHTENAETCCNATHGPQAKYPNGTKPKINVSFRLTRAGLVEVDKAEAAIEEMVEVEVCETIKPKKKNATDANATEVWRVLSRALTHVCMQTCVFGYLAWVFVCVYTHWCFFVSDLFPPHSPLYPPSSVGK
jgi:hypothetical protein